jgi:hypothetical protein
MSTVETDYKHQQEKMQSDLLRKKYEGFDGAMGKTWKVVGGKTLRTYKIIEDEQANNNLYREIRSHAIKFFEINNIEWWKLNGEGPNAVSGVLLSSQIACLNHLFGIRHDKEAVLSMINGLKPIFTDVKTLPFDVADTQGYISFEVVSDENVLGEKVCKEATRGAFCTSIDALIWAVDIDNNEWILPIEWKYTEAYKEEDLSMGNKGKTRLGIYSKLIDGSKHLKQVSNYAGSLYFKEPIYQLMRQMLNVEYMLCKGEYGWSKNAKILQIDVIPDGNVVLRKQVRPYIGLLKNPDEYYMISPKKLFEPLVESIKYQNLLTYLNERYWQD